MEYRVTMKLEGNEIMDSIIVYNNEDSIISELEVRDSESELRDLIAVDFLGFQRQVAERVLTANFYFERVDELLGPGTETDGRTFLLDQLIDRVLQNKYPTDVLELYIVKLAMAHLRGRCSLREIPRIRVINESVVRAGVLACRALLRADMNVMTKNWRRRSSARIE